ncbi:MAG: hypothetical protein ACRDJG_12030 [Actinomycetota bacterium]
MGMSAYELEALPELEEEYEREEELEGEWESEEFFRALAGVARRAAPALRGVGLRAARSALGGLGGVGGAIGGYFGPSGAALGRDLGQTLGRHARGWLPQSEIEGEWEWELEAEVNPLRQVYPDALMEHLGHAAAQTESEEEAEAFLGALVPLAARLIPRVAPAIMRAAPGLIRGVAGVARTLRANPTTRPLVRTLPTIVHRTAGSIARQAAAGRPVTPQGAVRTLARQTAGVLGSPQRCVQAYRRSRALDRRFHHTASQ